MIRKLSFIVVLSFMLVACAGIEPGNYYAIRADEDITPDHCYSQGEDEWCVQFLDGLPTMVPFLTPTPEPSLSPGVCYLNTDATTSVNVRRVPGGEYVATVGPNMRIIADARYQGADYLWYKVWWPGERYVWTADFYQEEGECNSLPYENPFRS